MASEVKQANIYDCHLISSLIALAKTNPKSIENCFTQGINEIDKKDDIEIRFFRMVGSNKTPLKIIVNKKKIILPQGIKDYALWPKLIEKAYSVCRQKEYEGFYETGKYDSRFKGDFKNGLDSDGSDQLTMFAITGDYPSDSKNYSSPEHTTKEKFTPQKIMETIKRKLEKGKALTCNFKDSFTTEDVKNHEKVRIEPLHSYAIVGIDITKRYIRLINTWKKGGRKYSQNINRNRTEPVKE